MKIDKKIKSIIEAVQSGKLNNYLEQIDNSDFGIYVPIYEEQGTIMPIPEGYSQIERNLIVSIERKKDELVLIKREVSDLEAPLAVGWFGALRNKDSVCKHGDVNSCKHCTSHTGACMHCTHPKKAFHQSNHSSVEMPELNYHKVVAQLSGMEDLLSSLAKHGVGLTLLHGHSDKFMFTRFPEGYVSVIANGITTFRKEKEVMDDKTFVPNVWRSISGKLHVAGGYSELSAK